MMEGTANIVVYHNDEVVRNTYEGMSFAYENKFSFVVPYTITFTELQYKLCQSLEADIVKRVTNILYRSLVVVFGGLMQFEVMPIVDETSIQQKFVFTSKLRCNTRGLSYMLSLSILLHMKFNMTQMYKMTEVSDEEFEATYEAGDEDDDGDVGAEAVAETLVVPAAVSQPMGIPPFMRSLDLDAMHASEFPEHANISVADPEDGEFRIRMEYGSRKSVIVAIRSYTISRGFDYVIYESEPQTFYAKCKNYGRRCDWSQLDTEESLLGDSKIQWEAHVFHGNNLIGSLEV
ncbi:hypothetical protein Ahy_A07g036093 [Arachis hypogaea]|uniref:Transposase MuDR plant domain-containing protein n=1 Tax=Arachis hypogaea TaxID=3818 RepID=A0A445CF79_ARAHY|nr:hypothetical protein Ahy_A07g036093 [Arachis hypogaea]